MGMLYLLWKCCTYYRNDILTIEMLYLLWECYTYYGNVIPAMGMLYLQLLWKCYTYNGNAICTYYRYALFIGNAKLYGSGSTRPEVKLVPESTLPWVNSA